MINLFKVHMPPRNELIPALDQTLYSGYVGEGPRVADFEAALSPWLGSPRVLALNNGTAALQLALRLAGVKPGDTVISTPMTCVATNMGILHAGAKIQWADINSETGEMALPAGCAGEPARVLICVDWGGYPCDLDALMGAGYTVIEDAAHALGAMYKGRAIGSIADFTAFSFQAIKHITTIDGGALTCRHEIDYGQGKLLRWYGIDRTQPRADFRCEADIREAGYKFHMNDVAATIGMAQLPYLPRILAAHRANAAFYDSVLAGLSGIRLPKYAPDRQSSYWLYTIHVDDRDRFMMQMHHAGIHTSQVHARNDKHSCFAEFQASLPGVDEFCRTQVSIPVGWWVGAPEREYIAKAIKKLRG